MFSGFMVNAWLVASMVAVVAGLIGFFVVLRGSAFVAHALPNGSFAGAAGATLIGVNQLIGLGVFSALAAALIGLLGRRGRHDVVTALTLVMLLALGSLFVSLSSDYAASLSSILFGEVLGLSPSQLGPTAALTAAAIVALAILYRPLMLSSVLADAGEARGVRRGAIELAFLLLVALTTTMTVPVVGTLLIFSLMIGPPAAARALTDRPQRAMLLSVVIALVVVWAAIAGCYQTDYPVGFFVGVLSAAAYVLGRLYAWARGRLAPAPALAAPLAS